MNDRLRGGARRAEESSLVPTGAWATHAALLLVQFAFASQAVEAKVAMLPRSQGGEEIFPEALAMIRMLGGALFFQAIVRARGPQGVAITRADHLRLVGLSVIGIALNQTLFLMGLRWTSPFSTSLLGATIPVFAAGLAVLFGKETLRLRTVIGLALAIAGVLSLIGIGSIDRGAILVALNSLSYAAYVVLSRDVVRARRRAAHGGVDLHVRARCSSRRFGMRADAHATARFDAVADGVSHSTSSRCPPSSRTCSTRGRSRDRARRS